MRKTLFTMLTVVASFSAIGVGNSLLADQAEEDAAVESYLNRIGLRDVLALHLEQSLERTAKSGQLAIAKKIADIYAAQMADNEIEDGQRALVSSRVAALVDRFPEANTPKLQAMLLEADFHRAEAIMTEWFNNRQDASLRSQAEKILAGVAPKFADLKSRLEAEIETLREQEATEQDDKKLDALDRDIQRLGSLGNMATYNLAWTSYYLGVCQTGPEAAAQFATARASFRELLGLVEADKYSELDPALIGLESSYISRSMIGLAQTELGLGNIADGKACYELVRSNSAPPMIRDLAPSLYLLGLVNAEQYNEAVAFASQHIETFTGNPSQGKANFCLVLIFAGLKSGVQADAVTQLGQLGIVGAAKLRMFALLGRHIAAGDIKIKDDSGFYLQWIQGQQQFEKAERENSDAGFKEAAVTLERALKQPEAKRDLASAANCRNLLGKCFYRLKEYEKAVEQFELVAPALKGVNDEVALGAAWNACVAAYQLAQSEPRFVDTAVAALQRVKRDFPESDQARKADGLIAGLKKGAVDPLESIASWKRVDPSDPKYATALFEISRLRHQIWRSSKGKTPEPAKRKEALAAIDEFLTKAPGASPALRLSGTIFAAEISYASGDTKAFQDHLNEAARLETEFGLTGGSAPQLHYYQLKVAQKAKDNAAIDRHARYLAENAAGTPYELQGLIILAKKTDQRLADATPDTRTARLEEAREMYRRIARQVGQSSQHMAKNKNARAANSKLAGYEFELGDYKVAAQRLRLLLEAFPKNQDYLRRAGVAMHRAKEYEAALGPWRTLLNGLPSGSEDWFEAKYHQLDILSHTDPTGARKVYAQFKLLHPKIPFASLREKFAEIDAKLGS